MSRYEQRRPDRGTIGAAQMPGLTGADPTTLRHRPRVTTVRDVWLRTSAPDRVLRLADLPPSLAWVPPGAIVVVRLVNVDDYTASVPETVGRWLAHTEQVQVQGSSRRHDEFAALVDAAIANYYGSGAEQ